MKTILTLLFLPMIALVVGVASSVGAVNWIAEKSFNSLKKH